MAQIDIQPLVPDFYNPAPQIAMWGEQMPPFSLPNNKYFVLGKGKEWNPSQVLARGMTQIQHNDLHGVSEQDKQALKNLGKTYHSVPITPELLGIGASGPNEWVGSYADGTLYNKLYFPNGLPNYNQGLAYGQGCDISHILTIGETMENTHYTDPRRDFWGGYYDGKAPRLDARFGPGNWAMAHDYLFINIGPNWNRITEAQAKAYYRNLPSLPNYDFTTGTLKHVNLYCGSGYLGALDEDRNFVYELAMKGRMYKALNKKFVCFWDPEREWMPNMKNGYKAAEGIFYHENKMPAPGPVTAGMVAAGLHFGDGFVGWNVGGKTTNRFWSSHWVNVLAPGSFWVKNGETQQRSWQSWPHLSGDQSYDVGTKSSSVDIAAFAAHQYASTLGQTVGGVTKAVKYKINNGPWYNPLNTYQDDLCYAKYHKQPIVETVVGGGKEALYFCEPCSNNQKKIVTIEGQTGLQKTFEACGSSPHLAIWNI